MSCSVVIQEVSQTSDRLGVFLHLAYIQDNDVSLLLLQIYRGRDSSYTIEPLQSDTTYRFRVRTCLVNGIGASSFCPQPLYGAFSRTIEITTLEESPVSVASLKEVAADSKGSSSHPLEAAETKQSLTQTLWLDNLRTIFALVTLGTLIVALLIGYMLS